ncbi:MAG: diaminopimelate decarboxylase [Candidatus Accumulibacter sp.]|jgi:diaminopimelate decarboxylase|nr:diaminopimelate decarboxylase [Accumulibacter sp.]
MNAPTSPFHLKDHRLWAESVPLADIAERFGTPCYVYSRAALEAALDEFRRGLAGVDAQVCYAVKANSNLAVLGLLARRGAGFDIVSGGELKRVLAAGGDPRKVVFSGVGKSAEEMALALRAGILCFNVESAPELDRLDGVAGTLGLRAPVGLRVNPDVDAKTHPYISTGLKKNKFGVAYEDAPDLYRRAARLPNIEVIGIGCHIGSQLLDPSPFAEALDKLLPLADRLAADGIALRHIDLGGGLGIRYREDDAEPGVEGYLRPLLDRLRGRTLKLLLEPGRRLVGNAGALLTRVEYLKPGAEKNFAVVDAAMNDLARPALYDAWHDIVPVSPRAEEPRRWEIVGPICESGDFLGHGRMLALAPGDLLAVMSAGAYGMAMSSNYNTRPRAAEVMVDGGEARLVRRRERVEELYAPESALP